METIDRIIDIDLPESQSAFLWGARKTGKSTYLKRTFPGSALFDFLQTDLFFEMNMRPYRLREQILAMPEEKLAKPILLDEVQKVPQVLDEVHWLIENRGLRFVLCGSSARKLKRGGANLLGGRAWRYEMFPLVWPELKDLDLLHGLNSGFIPSHFLGKNSRRSLQAYVQDYLKEEVFAEGLTRNIPAFSRFFEAMGYSHGELINHANIARECGIDAKTVNAYFQILVDTLIGRRVEPYKRNQERQVITKAYKFYLFDVGVAGALANRRLSVQKGAEFGHAFEHFIFTQLLAQSRYQELDYPIRFWRTKTGLEVDFILGDAEVAVEVKGASRVDAKELNPLKAFAEHNHSSRLVVVCNENRKRVSDNVEIYPWQQFLDELWEGKIIR